MNNEATEQKSLGPTSVKKRNYTAFNPSPYLAAQKRARAVMTDRERCALSIGLSVIALSETRWAIVSPEDVTALNAVYWSVTTSRRGGDYAHNCKLGKMHRFILARMLGRCLAPLEVADHINLDTLDNSRANLRACLQYQNAQNRARRKSSASPYKGVRCARPGAPLPWESRIKIRGKITYLGSFATADEAHVAYKTTAQKLVGEFARA